MGSSLRDKIQPHALAYFEQYIDSIWKLVTTNYDDRRYIVLMFIDFDCVLCEDGRMVTIETKENFEFLINELRLNYERVL